MDFDVVICGGGLAGASLASALEPTGLKIAVIERKNFDQVEQTSFDTRYLALTYGTGMVFRSLGLWQKLENDSVTEIRQIEVASESRRGLANLRFDDTGVQVLGWNVAANALGKVLVERIQSIGNVTVFSSSKICSFGLEFERIKLDILEKDNSRSRRIKTKLLVIADGGSSGLREKFNFQVQSKRYPQKVLVCRVESDQPHRGMAYEHFLHSGPLALLPVGESSFSVVWTVEQRDIHYLKEVDEQTFLTELQNKFGTRAGKFRKILSQRASYPLELSRLKKFVRPRVVVVGNASHTVHPVAGQGFNLALRDVAALADVLQSHHRWGWDIGSYDVLSHYESWRSRESKAVSWFTDSLIESFTTQSKGFSTARNVCLNIVGSSPLLRRSVLARTMGMYGKQSRLLSAP